MHPITVEEFMLGHGKAKGKVEYLSTTTSKYLFLDKVGRGPLKSILMRSKGLVAFMSSLFSGLQNIGFNSAQTRQSVVALGKGGPLCKLNRGPFALHTTLQYLSALAIKHNNAFHK